MTTIDTYVGERVHMLMWRERLPQRVVASRLGLTQGALSLKLRGKRPWHLHEVYEVANVLGAEPTDLMPPTRKPFDDGTLPMVLPQKDSNLQPFGCRLAGPGPFLDRLRALAREAA